MRISEQSNLEVNRDIRRVLVMHWIDIGRISVHTMKDRVHIRGSLMKLPGADSPLMSASVDVIYKKIKAAVSGRRLQIEFDNWTLNSATGAWEHGTARDKRRTDVIQAPLDKTTESAYRIEN